ncbi:MAG: enoyl-CoA hydratase/isomerase family protein [Gammaproteobacteria bacterium]|nr:enoyl-CoA hydratase/isomerase family protein [Gammaproteobacteria bacterium]
MASKARVSSTVKDGICVLVLDSPGRKNALSYALLNALNKKLAAAIENDARAVIVTGAGGSFSAGADFADLTGTIDDLAIDDAIEQAVIQLREMPAPVFAAVEGPCMGGAVDIALACDFLVAAEDAFFEVPAARLGLLYNPEAVRRWHARLSGQALRRILLLGERLSAAAALQAGVVSHLADTGAALDVARMLARRAAEGSRDAVAATKGLLVALEDNESDLGRWEKKRRTILDSPERSERVAQARSAAKD